MAALACNTITLVQAAQGFIPFSDRALLAAEAMFREEIDAKARGRAERSPSALLAAAVAWLQLSDHVQHAIEVRQLCQDAVDAGARSSCDALVLRDELKCFCGISGEDLRSIITFLKCARR